MSKENIIELWKNVGWNNLDDYHNHLNSLEERIIIPELHPDNVNPKHFWMAADEHFDKDPVCNHVNIPDQTRLTRMESNKLNYQIPLSMGMICQMDYIIKDIKKKFNKVNIAEIGCGYGSLLENYYMDSETSYTGFDLIKRTDYTEEIEGTDGTFSDSQVEKYKEKFNIFFSSNTFQHLSEKQITKYLTQVHDMLPYGGYFNLMYVVGSRKTYHYGQVVYIISEIEMNILLRQIGFNIIGSTRMQFDNSLTPYSLLLKK